MLTGYLGFAAASTECSLAALSILNGQLVPAGDEEGTYLRDRFSFSKKLRIRSFAEKQNIMHDHEGKIELRREYSKYPRHNNNEIDRTTY